MLLAKIKNKIPYFLYFAILSLILYLNQEFLLFRDALAQSGPLYLPNAAKFGDNIPQAVGGDTETQIKNIVVAVARNVKYFVGPIAIALIVYTGFRLTIARGDEAVYTEQKNALVYIVLGLVVIGISEFFGEIMDISGGGFLKDKNIILTKASMFDEKLQVIMTFVKYLLGSIAVGMMILSGFNMITAGDAEETMTKEKQKIAAGIFALIIIIIANTLINQIVFVVDKSRIPRGGVKPIIELGKAMAEARGVTNFMLMFIAPIMILMLIIGGVMYIFAGADEEKGTKAKAIIKNSLIGIAVAYIAYAAVSAVISGNIKF